MIGEEEKPICPLCESEIKRDDDFCPNCGTLFAEFVKCTEHSDKDAEGVCVICGSPYCEECGLFVDDRTFLCTEHSEYETIEGMACILSADDSMKIELIKSNLEAEGLHPFIFPRKASSIHSDIVYTGKSNNDWPLMVPFQEVIRAEAILHDLELLE
ncbi:hypothetical protein C0389_03210 [bacterium]|nr:hypothetical protein [bacterium]